MTHWNSFPRSLLFAALAAASLAPWLIFAGPVLGGTRAAAAYLVLVTAAYLGGLARDRRRRVAVFVASAAIGGAIAFVARSLTEETLGLAVLIATTRSGFLYRAPVSRAVVTEVVVIGMGLLFVRFLAGPSLAGASLAVWGFFLAQSSYFLVGGVRVRGASGRHPDPFEEACQRASALLDPL